MSLSQSNQYQCHKNFCCVGLLVQVENYMKSPQRETFQGLRWRLLGESKHIQKRSMSIECNVRKAYVSHIVYSYLFS